MTTAVTLTGFLDDEIVSEDAGTRARFRLCVSPTDDRVGELALPCTVADPEVARIVLSELEPGDRIHVTGYLGLPRIAGHPMWLHVATLELLDTPQPDTDTDDQDEQDVDGTAAASSTLSDVGRLERHGPYIVWSDPDRCADTVWTETGELLGTAVYPDTASTLIHTHQRRAAPGDA
jgi:hypothetical protein